MDHRHHHSLATASTYYQQHPHHLSPIYHPTAYHDPSLLYRPVQFTLPTQHQQQLQQPLQQQHQPPAERQRQLSLATSAGFQHPNFRRHHQRSIPRRTRAQTRRLQRVMAQEPIPQTSEEELAELQKLSNDYQPEATGPLVSQRQPSTNITTEYASADPVYQAKTAALPQKYSHYRTVRGDGMCGWRAVAFGYFEALARLGDTNKLFEELARLQSLSNVIVQAGYNPMLFEDFADEAFGLLREVATTNFASERTADEFLLDKFNDDMLQNYIITYLRLLTAAWMKTRSGEYAAWILGQSVDQYCEAQILPVSSEMEYVGLSALKDVLLAPAGIVLEVLYLDRSAGGEVNMHRFDPVTPTGQPIGSVRLLYRPGHYDILYKIEDMPPPPPQATIPTYLQYASQPHHEPGYDLGTSDFLTMVPGMSFANPSQGWMSSGYAGSPDFFAASPSTHSCAQPTPTLSAPVPQPQLQAQPLYVSTATPTHMVPPSEQMSQELVIRSVPHNSLSQAHSGFQIGPFRPSAWELDPSFVEATSTTQFQTAIFKNSHFNTAHFNNPDFQPEQWDPEDEYVTAISNGKGSRHKNSG